MLDDGTECILRRLVFAGKDQLPRFYQWTTGSPAAVTGTGQYLVDIHGQHEHQSLLRKRIFTASWSTTVARLQTRAGSPTLRPMAANLKNWIRSLKRQQEQQSQVQLLTYPSRRARLA